jgi:hypothetical protein
MFRLLKKDSITNNGALIIEIKIDSIKLVGAMKTENKQEPLLRYGENDTRRDTLFIKAHGEQKNETLQVPTHLKNGDC